MFRYRLCRLRLALVRERRALGERAQQEEREGQFGAVSGSLFQERLLSPGEEEAGNIVFRFPKGMAVAGAAALTVWIVDPAAADGAQGEIPPHVTPQQADSPVTRRRRKVPALQGCRLGPGRPSQTFTLVVPDFAVECGHES